MHASLHACSDVPLYVLIDQTAEEQRYVDELSRYGSIK